MGNTSVLKSEDLTHSYSRNKNVKTDWHRALLTRSTAVDKHYKSTQNVRRFMVEQCGEHFHFDRAFMAWIRDETPKNLGDVIDEWKRRQNL